MKKFFTNNLSVIAIIIAGLITIYFVMLFTSLRISSTPDFESNVSGSSIDFPAGRTGDTAFGGLFASIDLPDTLPHKEYRKLEDSIQSIRREIERENKSKGGTGTSLGQVGVVMMSQPPGDFGYYKNKRAFSDSLFRDYERSADKLRTLKAAIKSKDSITKLDEQLSHLLNELNRRLNEDSDIPQKKAYYLTLTGYELKDQEKQFYVSKGTYNLLYVKWDSIQRTATDSTRYGHYQSKSIPVRYAAEEKRIMIPITERQYKLVSGAFTIFSALFIFLGMYILLGLPIQILVNISRGKAFIKKNIRMFRQMSVALFVYALLSVIVPHVIRFAFGKTIPEDFSLPNILEPIFNNLYIVLVSIVLFLISKAFEKGYKLQEENDLTV